MAHDGRLYVKGFAPPAIDLSRCGGPEYIIEQNVAADDISESSGGAKQETHDIELKVGVSTGGLMKGWGNWVVLREMFVRGYMICLRRTYFDHGIVQTRK